jgi:hypothetical protein
MATFKQTDREERYLSLIVNPIRACAQYKPMFGKGRTGGLELRAFRTMYRADPFYNWMGLDSPLMYAAHKAAGGMTSIYRQIGIGCQWLFSALLQDCLGLSESEAAWSYQIPSRVGKPRTLHLDGRIELDCVQNVPAKRRVADWIRASTEKLLLPARQHRRIKGAVFEVRQGYKSKDSKRQNADIANASSAYASLYLPVLLLFSTQIDDDVANRYTGARWLLLSGATGGTVCESTYAFSRNVLGYELAGFFARNSPRLKTELEAVLTALLRT